MAENKKKKSQILEEASSPFETLRGQGAGLFMDDEEKAKEFLSSPFEEPEEPEKPKIKTEGEKRREAQELWERAYGEKAAEPAIEEPVKKEPVEETPPAPPPPEEEEEDVEEDEDTQATETISALKELPNPLDLAKERNIVTDEFLNEIASAKEVYNKTKDEVARKRLWEGIAASLANIAAGLYGMQTGVDLSGVKFEPSDWSEDLQQAQNELAAARTFAKDVKDVKLSELDERRDQRLREIQSIRQLNADAIDKLELERRNRKEANAQIKAQLEAMAEPNLAVEDKIADTELYKSYKDDKKRLESLYNKLPTMKSSDAKETISIMRDISTTMQAKVDRINQRLPEGEQFNNQYPPVLFAPTKGWLGEREPKISDLVERGIALSKPPAEQEDVKAAAISRAKQAGMAERDLRVYENYLNNPSEYDANAIREMLSEYGL